MLVSSHRKLLILNRPLFQKTKLRQKSRSERVADFDPKGMTFLTMRAINGSF